MTVTPNYSFLLPTVNGDTDTWGAELNTNWTSIDGTLKTVSNTATAAQTSANGALSKTANLSDVASAASARTNLGLGTAATASVSAAGYNLSAAVAISNGAIAYFSDVNGSLSAAPAGYTDLMLRSHNLSDVTNVPNCLSNLGLTAGATAAATLGLGSLALSSNTNALNAGSLATHNVTISTSGPSGTPADGDFWVQRAA